MIIGCGLGKTGTVSLKNALIKLGLTVWHDNTRGFNLFTKALKHNKSPLVYFPERDAYLDNPFDMHGLLLAAYYPEAKFICTQRDVDTWLDSREGHYDRSQSNLYEKDKTEWVKTYHANHKITEWMQELGLQVLVIDIEKETDKELWTKIQRFVGSDKDLSQEPFPWKNRRR